VAGVVLLDRATNMVGSVCNFFTLCIAVSWNGVVLLRGTLHKIHLSAGQGSGPSPALLAPPPPSRVTSDRGQQISSLVSSPDSKTYANTI
jgi:hypothetical protein